jgi:hypothetical protein
MNAHESTTMTGDSLCVPIIRPLHMANALHTIIASTSACCSSCRLLCHAARAAPFCSAHQLAINAARAVEKHGVIPISSCSQLAAADAADAASDAATTALVRARALAQMASSSQNGAAALQTAATAAGRRQEQQPRASRQTSSDPRRLQQRTPPCHHQASRRQLRHQTARSRHRC